MKEDINSSISNGSVHDMLQFSKCFRMYSFLYTDPHNSPLNSALALTPNRWKKLRFREITCRKATIDLKKKENTKRTACVVFTVWVLVLWCCQNGVTGIFWNGSGLHLRRGSDLTRNWLRRESSWSQPLLQSLSRSLVWLLLVQPFLCPGSSGSLLHPLGSNLTLRCSIFTVSRAVSSVGTSSCLGPLGLQHLKIQTAGEEEGMGNDSYVWSGENCQVAAKFGRKS